MLDFLLFLLFGFSVFLCQRFTKCNGLLNQGNFSNVWLIFELLRFPYQVLLVAVLLPSNTLFLLLFLSGFAHICQVLIILALFGLELISNSVLFFNLLLDL